MGVAQTMGVLVRALGRLLGFDGLWPPRSGVGRSGVPNENFKPLSVHDAHVMN